MKTRSEIGIRKEGRGSVHEWGKQKARYLAVCVTCKIALVTVMAVDALNVRI